MPKIVYNPSQGLVTQGGSGVSFNTSDITMGGFPAVSVQDLSDSTTVTSPGVYTLSKAGASAIVMPLASSFPGGLFVFRSTTNQTHYLTGSAEADGTKVFAGQAGATPDGQSWQLNFPAAGNRIGTSVSLLCDGKNFCIMAASGSFTLTSP